MPNDQKQVGAPRRLVGCTLSIYIILFYLTIRPYFCPRPFLPCWPRLELTSIIGVARNVKRSMSNLMCIAGIEKICAFLLFFQHVFLREIMHLLQKH